MVEPKKNRHTLPPLLNGLLSLLLPGLGQMAQRDWTRGLGLFVTALALTGLILWRGTMILFVPLVAIWLWGAWDAFQHSRGRPSGTTLPFLLAILIVYVIGAQTTEVSGKRLIEGWTGMRPIARALVHPELFARPTEERIGSTPFLVPCVDPLPAPSFSGTITPTVQAIEACASLGDRITIRGAGFIPNFPAEVWWQNPIGNYQHIIEKGQLLSVIPDAQGAFTVSLTVPPTSVPLDKMPKPGESQTHRIEVRQSKPYGNLQPTQTLILVVQKFGQTIALAFLASVLAVFFALPISFLAARNLMWGSPITRAIYFVVRAILNIIRSIETLIWAIIFAVWVGLGAFDGLLALTLHSIAALAKLYSEAIESIDPGPIEAVRATGANWPQVIVYAVLPQFMPSFLSFTLYRWDINVRMATVIGLVSDVGLGFLVIQWVRLGMYNAMSTAIIATVLVIVVLDYVSAFLRRRVIEGVPLGRSPGARLALSQGVFERQAGQTPTSGRSATLRSAPALAGILRRYVLPGALAVAFVAAVAWSWRIGEVDLYKLVSRAPEGLSKTAEFLTPELTFQPTESFTATTVLPVPCGSAQPSTLPTSGPRVDLSSSCGSPGDPLTIRGSGLPPNYRVSIRWVRPDGAFLRVKENCCDTDAQGAVTVDAKISPLLVYSPTVDPRPGQVDIVWTKNVGGPQPSPVLKEAANLSLITLLMALLGTTLGSLLAIPLSFLAARNIMGRSPAGLAVYNAVRVLLNLWRSIEPLILAVLFASWVGFGPFAGVISLALWNIPNLAKLFSETIEQIDTGPVEAVTATGAGRAQTLIYAIVPQLVPGFLAFILYQWDINIRMSTVIGFVGAGGIGQPMRTYIEQGLFHKGAVMLWAIVAMVWAMDYISAKVREKLV